MAILLEFSARPSSVYLPTEGVPQRFLLVPSAGSVAPMNACVCGGRRVRAGVLLVTSLLCAAALSASACKKEDGHPPTGETAAADAKSYATKGVIKSFGADRKTVNIAHENIPGYMSAMTMTFDAGGPAQLEGLAEGDKVDFTFSPAGGKHVLSAIKKAP